MRAGAHASGSAAAGGDGNDVIDCREYVQCSCSAHGHTGAIVLSVDAGSGWVWVLGSLPRSVFVLSVCVAPWVRPRPIPSPRRRYTVK